MPAKRTRRRLLLDHVAQAFEPGRRYPEATVDEILKQVFDDHCALRRYLIDEQFMSRTAVRRLLAGRRHRQLALSASAVSWRRARICRIARKSGADPLVSRPHGFS